MKSLLLGLFLALGFSFAYAQNPVVTNPSIRSAVASASTTIATTNTFQSVFAANNNRLGCLIQNNGTHNMYVNVVSLATATISTSAIVVPGATAGCALYGTVINGQISITGTSGEWFYASQF